jgi:putative membrane-bound dehydrogenase-like protein
MVILTYLLLNERRKLTLSVCLGIVVFAVRFAAAESTATTPAPPEDAAQSLETLPGFHAELVAAEPLVMDPVAGAFDENGNLYVCELVDYPYRPKDGAKAMGRIRLLRDLDGDGRFDESHIFAENMLWSAGIVCWKGGVFVTAPPDILYCKDTDGDFKADQVDRLFTGFGMSNQQGMHNNLQFGLDHKIYGSTSVNGGTIRSYVHADEASVEATGQDFRFDPETLRFELVSGTAQFGNAFDDWGNRFLCDQATAGFHEVLAREYIAANPKLAISRCLQDIAPPPSPVFRTSPIEDWRRVRTERRIANSKSAKSAGVSHHVLDGACGVTIYRGDVYPEAFRGNLFVCDAQNNLIHRRTLDRSGATFKSTRADAKTEFVRSKKGWFRPVNLLNAPDGTLYVLDMSRETIESIHIPLDVIKNLDLTRGRDRGRIFRIAPDGFQTPKPPRWKDASGSELVPALESPQGWVRDTAHRLIFERQDKSLAAPLRNLLFHSKLAQSRLHALWSLDGLKSLSEDDLIAALGDQHYEVRRNAIKLSESQLDTSPTIVEHVLSIANDREPSVRFQLSLTLGRTSDSRRLPVLAKLAAKHIGDAWFESAILMAVHADGPEFLALYWSNETSRKLNADLRFLESLAKMIAGGGEKPVRRTLEVLAANSNETDSQQIESRMIVALGKGLLRAGEPLWSEPALPLSVSNLLNRHVVAAMQTAQNKDSAVSNRVQAIELLGLNPSGSVHDVLVELIAPSQPPAIQIAAIAALTKQYDATIVDSLIARWMTFIPEVRTEIVRVLLSKPESIRRYLKAAEQKQISTNDLDDARRQMLLDHADETIRAQAALVFAQAGSESKQEVIARYQSALQNGNAAQGRALFERECSACHRIGSVGTEVGPNLLSSASQEPGALLANILDPNKYVLPNYEQYLVVDQQSRVLTGMMIAQTATSITLTSGKGQQEVVLRNEIATIKGTGKSLMPDGFENKLSVGEMSDLLTFLADARNEYQQETKIQTEKQQNDIGSLSGLSEPAESKK